ncbi:MAG: nicotinate-nucleotide diphosphorylase (carboxylating), partial [Planctomycetales bacterium]|nr:nicotinate-nucleotide diphosphorylase (carboxylating) [Planctomycetales bacterium]
MGETTRDFRQIVWDATVDDDCRQLVRLAVREDLQRAQDFTTNALVPHDATAAAAIVVREVGVLAGMPAVKTVLEEMAPALFLTINVSDAELVTPGTTVARIEGPARNLLTCERILLNFLGRLTGIATLARCYVDAVAGTGARIYDTRKTSPGWRRLEKYAARCGGATNHRTGLFDAVLIKDNHLAQGAASQVGGRYSPQEAVERARDYLTQQLGRDASSMPVEIEVDTL